MTKERKQRKDYIELLENSDPKEAQKLTKKEFEGGCFSSPIIQPAAIQIRFQEGENPAIEINEGKKSPSQDSSQINKDTASDIGSITKMYTSALLLKFWDQEITQNADKKYFPQGMKTKLSHLMPELQNKFPENEYLKEIEKIPHYNQVTLADLLNHTHGLGRRKDKEMIEMMMQDQNKQFSCSEMVNFSHCDQTKEKYGEYNYNNLGFDLAGMIIELVSGKSYDQALKDEILIPTDAQNTHPQEDLPELYADPDSNMARGYSFISNNFSKGYFGDEFQTGIINNNVSCNTRAAGGLKATAEDSDKFIRKFLSKDKEKSLFQNQEVIDALWDRQDKKYHFAVMDFHDTSKENSSDRYFGHSGNDFSFDSLLLYNPSTDATFYYCTNGETITHITAFDIASKINPKRQLGLDDVAPIHQHLLKNHSFEDLCAKRDEIIEKEVKNLSYKQGLNPTTPEFSDYINNSNDWANIGKEINYFIELSKNSQEFERVDAKGYVLTCMFKILNAVKEFEDGKRKDDPRQNIDEKTKEFLGGDLRFSALKQKVLEYGKQIIQDHGNEKTPYALSSVASVYGTRAYMQHLGMLTEEEAKPEIEPQKYQESIKSCQGNMAKNIALAMEKFEESAELGNVRSMGSVVTWAEKCNDPELLKTLDEKWTKQAATSLTPNPNSQIDFGKQLKKQGDLQEAEKYFKEAAEFGVAKAQFELGKLYFEQGAKLEFAEKSDQAKEKFKESEKWFLESKEKGFDLGNELFKSGISFFDNKEAKMAEKFLQEAQKQGIDVAQKLFEIAKAKFPDSSKEGEEAQNNIKQSASYLKMAGKFGLKKEQEDSFKEELKGPRKTMFEETYKKLDDLGQEVAQTFVQNALGLNGIIPIFFSFNNLDAKLQSKHKDFISEQSTLK